MYRTEVWAQLFLSKNDCFSIRDFFTSKFYVKPRYIIHNMHLTVYHSRRQLRDRLIQHETKMVLGRRPRSTHKKSAFGFRVLFQDLTFDRFSVDIVKHPKDFLES